MTSPDLPPDRGDGADGDSVDPGPNYLIRRGIAVGGVVAVIVAGAIVIGSLMGGEDDTTATGAANADWNSIVLVDERSGQIILSDENGDEQSRFASGLTNPSDAVVIGQTVVLTSAKNVSIVDLADESNQSLELDVGSDGVTMPIGTALTTLAASTTGDRAIVVHGPTGEVLDTDSFAPITGARYDLATTVATPSGRDLLITDSGNFQSVLLSFDRDEPSYFPGRALAIDDDLVVTTQNVGSEANITVFGHDGSSVTDARAPSIRAAMIADDTVIVVTVDGAIIELSTNKGTTTPLDTLAIGTVQTGYVSPGGDRLTVVGDAGSAIVDDTGSILGTFPDVVPLDTGIDEGAPRTSACVAFTGTSDSGLVIASLDDGAVVAEAEATSPMLPTVDGCAVVASTTSGVSVVGQDGVAEHRLDGDLTAVAPNGSSVVLGSGAGRLLLAPLGPSVDDEPGASVPGTDPPGSATTPIDLGPASRLVLFTQR